MNRYRKRAAVLAVAAALAVLTAAWVATGVGAQTSPNYNLSWHVMGSGGPDMTSAGHVVRSTLGQFAIGPADSPDHAVGSGYWYGIQLPIRFYLPLVLKNYAP